MRVAVADAQQAGMATADLAALMRRALFLDREDPAGAWRALHDAQARLIERLERASELRIEAEGTDLSLSVAGRTWINSDGPPQHALRRGLHRPVETSAQGRIGFDVPSSRRGVEVRGIELELRDGVVTGTRADRGDDVLQARLATDDGDRRLGEIGIGTNPGLDRS